MLIATKLISVLYSEKYQYSTVQYSTPSLDEPGAIVMLENQLKAVCD